jgi:hypothetical protein
MNRGMRAQGKRMNRDEDSELNHSQGLGFLPSEHVER